MKKVALFALLGILISCSNQTNEKANNELKEQNAEEMNNSNFGMKNFAVVGKWGSSNSQMMSDNKTVINEELVDLWKNNKIENVYLNNEVEERLGDYPNISFIVKAKSKKEAKIILDDLTIVKEGIASYNIFPVGTKWMGRNSEIKNPIEIEITYVAVWTNNTDIEPTTDDIKVQSDAILKLWNEGTIENVYFDIQGTQNENTLTDFVFFVNVNSEDEALEICDKLPFAKKNLASYTIHYVGAFWLGEYNQ